MCVCVSSHPQPHERRCVTYPLMSIFLLHSTWRRETTTTTTRRHHQRLNSTGTACSSPACSRSSSFSQLSLSVLASSVCHCAALLSPCLPVCPSLCLSVPRSVCLPDSRWVCLFKCNIYFMDCCYIFSSTFNPKTERINFPSISIHTAGQGVEGEAEAGAQLCELLTDEALHNFAPF